MSDLFYRDRDGVKRPVDRNQLVALAKSGEIAPDTIIENSEGKRVPAGKIRNLVFAAERATDARDDAAEPKFGRVVVDVPRRATITTKKPTAHPSPNPTSAPSSPSNPSARARFVVDVPYDSAQQAKPAGFVVDVPYDFKEAAKHAAKPAPTPRQASAPSQASQPSVQPPQHAPHAPSVAAAASAPKRALPSPFDAVARNSNVDALIQPTAPSGGAREEQRSTPKSEFERAVEAARLAKSAPNTPTAPSVQPAAKSDPFPSPLASSASQAPDATPASNAFAPQSADPFADLYAVQAYETTVGNSNVPRNSGAAKFCTNCGASLSTPGQKFCTKCGAPTTPGEKNPSAAPGQIAPRRPLRQKSTKNKDSACWRAFLLGNVGLHKLYLGSWGWFIVYLLFFWTFIPGMIAFCEGISFLSMTDEEFDRRYAPDKLSAFHW